MRRYLLTILLLTLISACSFDIPSVEKQFGTQNFFSAVSIIELHKLRNGEYPESLDQLEFLGDWDGIWLSAIRYEKNEGGYNLFLERGWTGKPILEFPIKFKLGLGIKKTNVKWVNNKSQI